MKVYIEKRVRKDGTAYTAIFGELNSGKSLVLTFMPSTITSLLREYSDYVNISDIPIGVKIYVI